MYLCRIQSDQLYTWSDEYPERAHCRLTKTSQRSCAPTAPAASGPARLPHRALQTVWQAGMQMHRRPRPWSQVLSVDKLPQRCWIVSSSRRSCRFYNASGTGRFLSIATGFRPGRSTHQAVSEAQQHIVEGHRWVVGVSSQGHMIQSVRDRPRLTDSGLVAGEAPWRESKTAEPSDEHIRKEYAQRTRLQRAVNADVASLHESPVAETVDNARKQQELAETSPMRQLSPAGYQRRHGVKDDVETGEALGARRRNLVEEMPAITVSGKCRHRHQGDGSGRSTVDGRAAKRARRKGPGPVSIPLVQSEAGVR